MGFISDQVLVIISNVGQSKDVGNTLGLIPELSIPREVVDLIDGHGAIIAAEVYSAVRCVDVLKQS